MENLFPRGHGLRGGCGELHDTISRSLDWISVLSGVALKRVIVHIVLLVASMITNKIRDIDISLVKGFILRPIECSCGNRQYYYWTYRIGMDPDCSG